ncbi:MAG: hypothetical protein EOM23_08250 [Candidatus Moranbacteria bacterium]|nr:hypothetical protein [Candidatus Moranbacteria bacterium]
MKERSILYFMAAIVITLLTIISFFVTFAVWAPAYADDIIPVFYVLLIPVAILWFGWFIEDRGLLLTGTAIVSVLFILHLEEISILSQNVFLTPQYAPIVRTIYVVTFGLLLATMALGVITSYFMSKQKA